MRLMIAVALMSFSMLNDITQLGGCIYPKSQARLAKELGASGDIEAITQKVVFTFNSGDPRLKRRVEKGVGFVYEKITE